MSKSRTSLRYPRPGGPSMLYYAFRNRNRSARSARFALSRSRTNTRTKNRQTSGLGVTTQHDARLIYRKRRMPRRMRKRWKRFRNKVLAVSEKDLGTQQVVISGATGSSNTTDGRQVTFECSLYGLKSSSEVHNDLTRLTSYLPGSSGDTPAAGLALDPSSKIMFQSAVLDITIRNASTYYNGSTYSGDSAARMEVDVYEITMNHTAEETGTAYATLSSLFAQNNTQCRPLGGSGVELDIYLRGVTPFELSYVLSRFNLKIWKKTKYQLSNGDQVTYQMRDPRRHSYNLRELSNQDGFNLPKLSKFVFIIGKLAPGLTVGSAANTYQEVLNVGCTRKYNFKIENYSEDRTIYYSHI